MDELIFTTVLSVVAVNIVAFFFIPHWTAVLFMLPTIAVVFVEMLGKSQNCFAQSRASSKANEDALVKCRCNANGWTPHQCSDVCLPCDFNRLDCGLFGKGFLMADYS